MCQREREGGREENNRELELLRLQEQREREKIAYLCERDRVKERERERERESPSRCVICTTSCGPSKRPSERTWTSTCERPFEKGRERERVVRISLTG